MTRIVITAALVMSFATAAMAQSAGSGAQVGPGGVGGSADASGSIWTYGKTDAKTGKVDVGRGLAIGVGPNGLSLSHSIAAGKGPLSVGHNLNMTIGQNGTHVSQGGVVTQGGNTSAQVGGSTQGGPGLGGGSNVGGNGWNNHAWTDANTQHRHGYQTMPVQTTAMPMTSGPMPVQNTMGRPMPIRNTMGQPVRVGQPVRMGQPVRIGQPVQMGQPINNRVVYPQVMGQPMNMQGGSIRTAPIRQSLPTQRFQPSVSQSVRHFPVRFGR